MSYLCAQEYPGLLLLTMLSLEGMMGNLILEKKNGQIILVVITIKPYIPKKAN